MLRGSGTFAVFICGSGGEMIYFEFGSCSNSLLSGPYSLPVNDLKRCCSRVESLAARH